MKHGTIGRLVFATLLLALGTTRPAAAVDMSGDYVVVDPIPCRFTFAQTGTGLQLTGSCGTYPISASGTVDPTTGAFSVTGELTGACSNLVISGTGDGEAFTGTYTGSGLCASGGTVSGSKCSNGVIDPGENCEDGNAVSGDCCSARCVLEPAGSACTSDSNVCTNDVCNATGMCTHVPNTGPCDDGNACTNSDVCSGGACTPGSPAPAGQACDSDSNDCTTDVCNATGMCTHVPNTGPCDDGNACTNSDVCSGGACIPGSPAPAGQACDSDFNTCTYDVCNGTGTCTHSRNSACVPSPGECFNGGGHPDPYTGCSGGCTSSSSTCASDDTGCVPDTKDHLKCEDAIVKAYQKAIRCVTTCHCKQAAALLAGSPFNEEACEGHNPPANNACQDKFDGVYPKINNLCSGTQLQFAQFKEGLLWGNDPYSFDAQNGALFHGDVFCDSTSGKMIMSSDSDDAGWVPKTKDILECECTVGKNLSKLAVGALRCHIRMADAFFKGNGFDENACEEVDPAKGKAALQKYTQAETAILSKGICPPCLDQPHQDALGAGVLAQMEDGNSPEVPTSFGYKCP